MNNIEEENKEEEKMEKIDRNIIKYTVGIPIIIIMSLFYIIIMIFEFFIRIANFITGCQEDDNVINWFEDIIDLWKPIKLTF